VSVVFVYSFKKFLKHGKQNQGVLVKREVMVMNKWDHYRGEERRGRKRRRRQRRRRRKEEKKKSRKKPPSYVGKTIGLQ
jgi:hypothetical protein